MNKQTIPFVARMEEDEMRNWLEMLRPALPQCEIIPFADLSPEQRQSAQVAICANPDPADLAKLPALIWIQSLWAGVEKLLAELPDANFKIVRLKDPQMATTMAQSVLAATLYLHRDMPLYRRQQQQKIWQQNWIMRPQERTIGILGLGNLGQKSALALRDQNFDVCGWARSERELEGIATFSGADGFEQILARAQILVVLLPLTPQTRGLLDQKNLSKLPKGASLINFARGHIVDEAALMQLLDKGHLSHALLDVFAHEPLPADDPLWQHQDITIWPHVSALTDRQTASKIAADNITAFLENGILPETVSRKQGY